MYLSTSIVGDFDFAGRAGLAVGDAAVGEFGEGFFSFGTLFLVADALQVAGCEGLHGFCSDLYLKCIPRGFFGAFVR